jgi:hypothetical protein
MSTRWNPNWRIIEIEIAGKKVEICFDEVTKLYACPLCSSECKKGLLPTQGSYFFSVEDLKFHIEAHKLSLWSKTKREEEEEEEEETEEEEEEFE